MGKPTAKAVNVKRGDAWANALTKVNTSRDKRNAASLFGDVLGEGEAEELYLASDIAAKAVDLPVLISLRRGFSVGISQLEASEGVSAMAEHVDLLEADERASGEITNAQAGMAAALDELSMHSKLIEACQWEALYGGCAQLMGIDDGQKDLTKPVRWQTARGVRYLVNLRPRECWPVSWNTNELSAGYGRPVVYQVMRDAPAGVQSTRTGFRVHASRIVRFPGLAVSRRAQGGNRGWGRSILDRMVRVIRDFDTSYESIPILLQDFAQGVVKMEGLADLFAAGDADEVVAKRIEAVDMMRGMLRLMFMDSKDSFERQSTPVSGLSDMLDRMANRTAAAVGIPVNLLFNSAPAGLNATGDSNVRWFYDQLQGDRDRVVTPKVNQVVRAIFRCLEGPTQGQEPGRWSTQWEGMWLPTEGETADVRLKTAQADVAYVQAGVLLPEEVAANRFGADRWSAETKLDMKLRRAVSREPRQAAANADPNLTEERGSKPEPIS